MSKNPGKKFEEDFRKSCKKIPSLFYHRLKDGTSSWGSSESRTRFQCNNPCDVFLYKFPILLALELKHINGKSLPFSNIRENQIKELTEFSSKYYGIICGFLVMFSSVERCYFLSIDKFNEFIENNTESRKSIPLSYFTENGIELKCSKKKVSFTYGIEEFMQTFLCQYNKQEDL